MLSEGVNRLSSKENFFLSKFSLNNLVILIILIILSFISFFIIQRFIVPLIFTGVLVYVFQPVYDKIYKLVRYDFLASIISIFLIIGVILVPTFFTFTQLYKEFSSLENGKLMSSLDLLSKKVNERYGLSIDFKEMYNQSMSLILEKFRYFMYEGVPKFFFNVFIFIFFFYYFLKNSYVERYYFNLLFKRNSGGKWNHKFKELIYGIIYGQIFVKLIQAGLAVLLFFLIGIDNVVLWGVLIFFAAFVPIIGTGLIWIPMILLHIVQKDYQLSFLIFIVGLFISSIDNLLTPYIISDKIKVGPVLTVISIFGGLQVFGLYGLILGPFFIGLFILFLEEFFNRLKFFEEKDGERSRKFIWTDEERARLKKFRTEEAKKEYIRMINRKYEKLAEKKNSC